MEQFLTENIMTTLDSSVEMLVPISRIYTL